jgi:predicted nucleotidyltransferase
MAVYQKLGAEAFGHSVTGLLESLPEYSREELLSLLRGRIADLRGKLRIRLVSLFGSYAKGRQTAAGDIDLLVVYDGERRCDDYKLVWDTLGIPRLQIYIYTLGEFEKLAESKSQLPREAVDKGIIHFRLKGS